MGKAKKSIKLFYQMLQSQAWDVGISTGYQASGMQFKVLPRTVLKIVFSEKMLAISKDQQTTYKSQTSTVARP